MFRRHLAVLASLAVFACAFAPRALAQGTSVTLSWTAPGDDGNVGTASQYEVRYSTSPIDAGNFAAATLAANPPAPLPAGSAQAMFLLNLQASTPYWVAVRTVDDRGNWSAISNVVNFTTSAGDDTRPAAAVVNAGTTTSSTVTLHWNATGDDSLSGIAHHYEVRWSTSAITPANFASATPVATGVPSPGAPGAAQQCTIGSLNRNVDLWFAVRVHDEAGNPSALSNVVRVDRLLDTAPPATPTGVTAAHEPPNVRIEWTANTEPDLGGYHVWRAPASSGPFTRLDASTVTGLEFVDTSVPDSISIWYAVTAVDGEGNESARSAPVQVWLRGGGIAAMRIEPVYPNPSPLPELVNIPIAVPAAGPFDARVDILNAAGERVRSIEVHGLSPGTHTVTWDGRSDGNRTCAPGVYRAWLQAGGVSQQVKLVRTP